MTTTITFRRIRGRSWSGNGFGYIPALYGVFRDGQMVGTIQYGPSDWHIYAPDFTNDYGKSSVGSAYKLADAKRMARDIFTRD
jgi:hypothetical protein